MADDVTVVVPPAPTLCVHGPRTHLIRKDSPQHRARCRRNRRQLQFRDWPQGCSLPTFHSRPTTHTHTPISTPRTPSQSEMSDEESEYEVTGSRGPPKASTSSAPAAKSTNKPPKTSTAAPKRKASTAGKAKAAMAGTAAGADDPEGGSGDGAGVGADAGTTPVATADPSTTKRTRGPGKKSKAGAGGNKDDEDDTPAPKRQRLGNETKSMEAILALLDDTPVTAQAGKSPNQNLYIR